MSNKITTNSEWVNSINNRLDALIRISVESLYEKRKKFNETTAIQLLHTTGLTPTEIAKILGKKGPTSIAPYLYKKTDNKGKKNLSDDKDPVD